MAIAAAVFVAMFLTGAMRALREEPRDAKPNATSPSSIEGIPAATPTASPAPPAVAPLERSAAPATSTAEPVASAEPVTTGESTRVMVRATVAGAKFYRSGRQVGMNSVIVELAPGEKRTFEVNLAGHVSRKVVVDGSRSEVVVVLPRISEARAAPARSGPTPVSTGEAAPGAPQEDATP